VARLISPWQLSKSASYRPLPPAILRVVAEAGLVSFTAVELARANPVFAFADELLHVPLDSSGHGRKGKGADSFAWV
jgi:hypothetical protein